MQFFKKALVSVLLVLAIAVPVFATVNVTWEWVLDDPDVQYFRYQLGGEADDAWTVVPSDVTTFELQNVDGSVAYTLYLQQSYDGTNWSASAFAVSTPLVPEAPAEPIASVEEEATTVEPVVEEAIVAQEVAPVETEVIEEPVVVEEAVAEPVVEEAVVETEAVEEPVVVEEEVITEPVVEEAPVEEVVVEEAVAVEEPVVATPVAEEKLNKFTTTFDLSSGAVIRFEQGKANFKDANKGIKFNIGLGFENILSFGKHSGFGLWFDGFGILDNATKQPSFGDYFKLSNYGKEAGVDALLTYNFTAKHFKMIAGAGADFRLSPAYADGSFTVFKKNVAWSYDIVGQLQAKWQITDLFSLGLIGNYSYNIKNKVHEAGATLSMGFSF